MAAADFIHLRVHSAYSLSEGALKIEEIAGLAQTLRMPAVAITDTNNLFGALEFAEYCSKSGIQPIIGVQLNVRQDGQQTRQGLPVLHPLILLAQNKEGYQNLLRLVSAAHLETAPPADPHVSLAQVQKHAAGLLCLTGGMAGLLAQLLANNQKDQAEIFLKQLSGIYPGRLYIELQRFNLPHERKVEDELIELANIHHVPLVATNEAFFSGPEMFEAHDALICIAEGKAVADPDRRKLTPNHYFKNAAEMRELFKDLPEAIDNTLIIAKRCAFMPVGSKPLLPAFPTPKGRDQPEELRLSAKAGLEERFQQNKITDKAEQERYLTRLDYEIDMIIRTGFAGYFLIVADFIKWAKAQNIPVGPGRGSGAGSVAAWALTITDLDPLRWGLLFERFLNPDRVSMPDFDIDFCQDRRDEVIRYVQTRYGRDRVAQIITFGKLQARAVLRDVGRVIGLGYNEVDRICKLIPNNPAQPTTLEQAIDGEPLLQQARKDNPEIARLMNIGLKLEGLYRHASTHAAGVVIGDRPLEELVPLYRDPKSDIPATQFSMKYVEKAGLVKFDFLGLKTLTVLQKAVNLLAEQGIHIDLITLPLDDKKTYDMLSHGDASGVFQLESSGMRDTLRKLKPDRFEDIIAVVALYRPGPMDNIPAYIARKHGQEKADYLHPSLEPILKETYGIMIYQEQVMQIAQVLSGYSLGQADLLRRAMGKKIASEMAAQRQSFVDGAFKQHKVPAQKAGEIFDLVDKFAGYGFNKSHAAAYALIAYQTAYLKANYPVAFMAAIMTLDAGNTDKLGGFKQELQRLDVQLLPPDINKSFPHFAPEGNAIRYALAAIKGVGDQAMQALVAERQANGPFKNIENFVGRLDGKVLNKRQLEALIGAGAFDSLEPNRALLAGNIEKLVKSAAKLEAGPSLFGGDDGARFKLDPAPAWSAMEKLQHEFDALGFYLSAHPLDAFRSALKKLKAVTALDFMENGASKNGLTINMAGVVIAKKERRSQKGNKYAFVQFSDLTGVFEVTVFSEILNSARDLLESSEALLVSAEVQLQGETVRLTAQSIQRLEPLAAKAQGDVVIRVSDQAAIEALQKILAKAPNAALSKGRFQPALVTLLVQTSTHEVEINLPKSPPNLLQLKHDLAEVPGAVLVEEI
ncbi:MAG: DNA polymerase III subunit alpha [Dongiaceae bacterium]